MSQSILSNQTQKPNPVELASAAVNHLIKFQDLPKCQQKRLLVVDAGIATQEQFAAATEEDALLGRWRKNGKLRATPAPKKKGKRGRPAKHGAILHPGIDFPEIAPIEDITDIEGEKQVRVRRWNQLHFEDFADMILDVVRVDHPDYDPNTTRLSSKTPWRGKCRIEN